jgi:glycosyltransferase involved in cell wall biosynthesis
VPEKDIAVSILLPSLRGGGAERVMLNIGKGLSEDSCKIEYVLVKATGSFLKQVPTECRVIDLGARKALTALPSLIRYLKSQKPTVVLSSLPHINLTAIFAVLIARTNTKVVLIEHNTLSQSMAHSSRKVDRLLPYLMRIFYRFSDHIVAVSNGVAVDLEQMLRLPKGRLSVIYNPVITPDLLEKSNRPIAHPWYQKRRTPVILAIGRLTQAKCFDLLLRSFQKARLQEDANLIILGEGPDRKALEALTNKLNLRDHVQLPGFVDNPYQYIKNSNLFVLSSLWEGLPTVLIEALYLGVPIISTDCPSGPKEILKNGRWGTLIPMKDADALTTAIVFALRNRHDTPPKDSWAPFTQAYAISCYQKLLRQVTEPK